MFVAWHHRRSVPGRPNLKPAYSDSSVTFFEPPSAMPALRLIETDAYVAQVHGTAYPSSIGSTSSAETIAGAVLQDDGPTLAKLNGTFVAAVYDKRQNRLRIASDRYGTVRAFVGEKDGILYCLPRLHYFRDLGFEFRLDRELAAQLLVFRYLAEGRVLLKDVSLLPPGSVLTLEGDASPRTQQYWSWQSVEHPHHLTEDPDAFDPASIETLARELVPLWNQAVERRLQSDQRIVIPLSGGLDSRAILAAALKCKNTSDILTCTFGPPGGYDYEIPKIITRQYGLKHVQVPTLDDHAFLDEWKANSLDSDGSIDNIYTNFANDLTRLRDFSTTFAVGYLGETIGGGHLAPWMLAAGRYGPGDSYLMTKFLFEHHAEVPIPDVATIMGLSAPQLRELLLPMVETTLGPSLPLQTVANRCHYWDFQHRQRIFINPTVQKRQGEFWYLLPFTDHQFVDRMLQMPLAARLGSRVFHKMLTLLDPALFGLPTANFKGKSLVQHLGSTAADYRRGVLGRQMQRWSALRPLRRWVDDPFGVNSLRSIPGKFVDFPKSIRQGKPFLKHLDAALDSACGTGLFDKKALRQVLDKQMQTGGYHWRALMSAASLGVTVSCFDSRRTPANADPLPTRRQVENVT